MERYQNRDQYLRHIKNILEINQMIVMRYSPYKLIKKLNNGYFTLLDGILVYDKTLIVIPKALKRVIIDYFHSNSHRGRDGTLSMIKTSYYYWPGMYTMYSIRKSCNICQLNKAR